MRLHDKVVWITGSARRVGRVMALACAAEGAHVVVHAHRSVDEAHALAAEIRALGREAQVVLGNVGHAGDVRRMVDEISARWGRLDALVNNAATFPAIPFEATDEEDFFAVIRANLFGPFACAQAALPLLRAATPGRIVNITDWAVERPYRGHAAYMASKGGLDTLTRALARELAPDILVNAIAPGPVLEPEDLRPERRAAILARMPLGRWGTPIAVAQALLMLLENDSICGETIIVDAGRHIG
jgi:pteridine reductase